MSDQTDTLPAQDFLTEPTSQDNEPSLTSVLDAAFADAFKEPKAAPEPKAPEPKAPEPKSEPGDEDGDKLPEGSEKSEWWKDTKAGDAFAKIRAEAKTAKKEAEQLRKELEEFKKYDPKEIEELKTKYQDHEKHLTAFRVENSDLYREQIRLPLARIAREAEELGGQELVDALSEDDRKVRNSKVSAIMDTSDRLTCARIERLEAQMDEIFERRGQILKDSENARKEIEAEEAKRTAERSESEKKLFQSEVSRVWEKLTGRVPADLLTGEVGQKVLSAAKEVDLTRVNKTSQALAATAVNLLPHMSKLLQQREAKIKELEATLSDLGRSSPRGGSAPSSSTASSGGEDRRFSDAVDDAFRQSGW